jgi:hypothetical protein
VNDKSFALLQGYLDLMREQKAMEGSSHDIQERFTLSFWTKDLEKPAMLDVVLPKADTQ